MRGIGRGRAASPHPVSTSSARRRPPWRLDHRAAGESALAPRPGPAPRSGSGTTRR